MKTPLEGAARVFNRRLALRRRMLAHLHLDPSEEDAPRLVEDLRDTLLGCMRCSDPEACARWIDANCPRTPPYCRAQGAFLRLEAELDRPLAAE
jgi:hypothetical protein